MGDQHNLKELAPHKDLMQVAQRDPCYQQSDQHNLKEVNQEEHKDLRLVGQKNLYHPPTLNQEEHKNLRLVGQKNLYHPTTLNQEEHKDLMQICLRNPCYPQLDQHNLKELAPHKDLMQVG